MLPPIETNCLVWAAEAFRSEPLADVDFWHIATFRCAAEFGRYLGIADIEQAVPIKFDL